MSARPDPNPSAELDALVRDAEFQVLRRLTTLTESENERVALRACEVLLRYVRDRREEASAVRQPPDAAPRGACDPRANASGAPAGASAPPSVGSRPSLASATASARLHPLPVAENVLDRAFDPEEPNTR